MAGSLTKGYLGKEDMYVQTNTSASETFNRLSSTGSTVSITKVPDIWAGTGKVEVAECETDVLSNDSSLSVQIGGTETASISSTGLQIKRDSSSLSSLRGSLTLYNTNTGSAYTPGILLKSDNSGWEGYQACLISALGALVLIGTEDTWATTKTILSATPNNFTITSNTNTGYFALYQTHTSSDGSIAGEMRQWIFQDEDMADDATVALPTGVQGICMANAYGNAVHAVGMWSVLTDGTVLLIAGTQYDDADTDGNLCLYDDGSGAVLKQRLGGAAKVRVIFHYY